MEWGEGLLVSPPAVAVEIDALIALKRDSGKGSGGDGAGKKSWRRFPISIADTGKPSLSSMKIPSTGVENGLRNSLINWGSQVFVSTSGFNPESKIFFGMRISSRR
jgi:hypothetical protein